MLRNSGRHAFHFKSHLLCASLPFAPADVPYPRYLTRYEGDTGLMGNRQKGSAIRSKTSAMFGSVEKMLDGPDQWVPIIAPAKRHHLLHMWTPKLRTSSATGMIIPGLLALEIVMPPSGLTSRRLDTGQTVFLGPHHLDEPDSEQFDFSLESRNSSA